MKYELTITLEQARVLLQALDLYSRIGIGQITEVALALQQWPSTGFYQSLEQLQKSAMNPYRNQGITSDEVPDKFKQAADILQVIRHRISWDQHPSGGITVNFDPPMRLSKDQELPTIQEK